MSLTHGKDPDRPSNRDYVIALVKICICTVAYIGLFYLDAWCVKHDIISYKMGILLFVFVALVALIVSWFGLFWPRRKDGQ